MAEENLETVPRANVALPLSRVSAVAGYGVGKTALNIAWPIVRFSADAIYRFMMEIIARPGLAGLRGAGNLTVALGFQLPTYLIYNILGRLPYYVAVRPLLMLARSVLPEKGETITNLMKGLDEKYKSFKTYWRSTRVYNGWQTAKKHMNVKSLEHFIHDFFDARMEGVFKWGNSLTPNKALLALVVCFGILAPLSPALGILLHGYSFPWFMPDWLAAGAHAALPMLKSAALGALHYGQALWAAPWTTISATLGSGIGFIQTAIPSLLTAAQTFGASLYAAPVATLTSLLPSLATAKMVAFEAVKLPVLMAGFVVTNVCATFFPKAKLLLPAVLAACANQASKSPFGGKQLAAWLNHTHKLEVVHDVKKDAAFADKNIVKPWTNHALFGASVLATAVIAPTFVWVPITAYVAGKAAQRFVFSPIAQTQTWQTISTTTRQTAGATGSAVVSGLERIPLLGRAVTYIKDRTIYNANDENVVDKVAGVLAPFAEKSSAQYWQRRLGTAAPVAEVAPPVQPEKAPVVIEAPATPYQPSTTKSVFETLMVYGTSATVPLLTALAAQTAFKVDGPLSHALSGMVGGHEVAAIFSGIFAATAAVATFASTTSIAKKLPDWLFRPAAAETTINQNRIDNARGALVVEGLAVGTIGLAAMALGAPIPMIIGGVASWGLTTLAKGRRQVAEAYAPQRTDMAVKATLPTHAPAA